jgi:hypothetical protein
VDDDILTKLKYHDPIREEEGGESQVDYCSSQSFPTVGERKDTAPEWALDPLVKENSKPTMKSPCPLVFGPLRRFFNR